MDQDSTSQLQMLLDRLRQGDKQARREFLEQVCNRLRRLAATILSGSFRNLQGRHEVDSVVHETWLRLMQAMEKADPPTVTDFFRLAAHKIRQVLLDMVVGAQAPEPVIDFLKRLQSSPLFGPATVYSSQPPSQNEPLYRYRVSVEYGQKL